MGDFPQGYFFIRSVASGKVLDVYGNSKEVSAQAVAVAPAGSDIFMALAWRQSDCLGPQAIWLRQSTLEI